MNRENFEETPQRQCVYDLTVPKMPQEKWVIISGQQKNQKTICLQASGKFNDWKIAVFSKEKMR